MRKSLTVILVTAFVAVSPLIALAGPITVPPGLHPGDHYRLAFVTSTGRDGTSTDIADYNAFVISVVTAAPQLAALGTTWSAIASTDTVDARDNTSTNPLISTGYPIYNLGGSLVASSNALLWSASGNISAPIDVNEAGTLQLSSQSYVWTGTGQYGVKAQDPWRLGNPRGYSQGAAIGFDGYTNGGWLFVATADLPVVIPFYGLSGVLTVVPEPSSMVLAFLAAASLTIVAIRKHWTD